MKKCSKCGLIKSVDEFRKRKTSKDGLRNECKTCLKKYIAKWRKNHTQEIKASRKIRYQNHSEEIKKQSKEYRRNHIEEDKAKRKIYLKKHSDIIKQKRRQFYLKNKEKIKISHKYYTENNKEKIRERKRIYQLKHRKQIGEHWMKYYHQRYKTDIQFRIKHILRSRLSKFLTGDEKPHTIELLGCSLQYFKKYIEKQLKEGMTWGNYGFYSWHLDHIRPCSLFNLTEPEQQRQCFNYKNLQPLWAIDNFRKQNKWKKIA